MPAGRPTEYKPEFCDEVLPFMEQGYSITAFAGHVVVYALCDENGKPFYVGKSKNIKKRLQAYKSQKAHGNKNLQKHLLTWVNHQNIRVLSVDPENVTDEEYRWINKLPDLCNIMTKPFYAKSSKPWIVPGAKCPSAQVRQHVKRNLGGNVDWVKYHGESLSDKNRLEFECAIALTAVNTCLSKGINKWISGLRAA